MYRPVQEQPTIRGALFSQKNVNTLEMVLLTDFQKRNQAPLNDQQRGRLSKTLDHYMKEVYDKQGDKPIQHLNKEILGACARDFTLYLQRDETTRGKNVVKQVMDDQLYKDTSQRFERLTQERNETKAVPPTIPDFRISLKEDGPAAADLFEQIKKNREMEALRSEQQLAEAKRADAGLQQRIQADSLFRSHQDSQNRSNELALVERQNYPLATTAATSMPLTVLPDRRELLRGSIGSFDTMTAPPPRELGQANGNPTIVYPTLASPEKDSLPQNIVVREEKVVNYREIENNLFIYSADRDWLRNNKENRYQFTVSFDPAANGQSFGPNLAAQQKFRNIVRIELVKAILPGESLNVTIHRTKNAQVADTTYQDNILNLPYVMVRVAELENNNYGTDNFLDRSFGVLQYDAKWISDQSRQSTSSQGYLAMIPKFLKCQKEYYPNPMVTLQKMTIDLRRPNGDLLSSSPDTFDIGGILAPQANEVIGDRFPFTNTIKFMESPLAYNMMIPGGANGSPANFYINTVKHFNRFEISEGDRIQISGYGYNEAAFNDATYGQSLRNFCQWINRPEGHIVLSAAYTINADLSSNTNNMRDGFNEIGYANFLVIQARYQDPSSGLVQLDPFGPNFGGTLNAFGASLDSPIRLINLNKQTSLVFRIITREMDSLPQLRPDNVY
jgi:hypothetical protein